jgi:hypothetical protein
LFKDTSINPNLTGNATPLTGVNEGVGGTNQTTATTGGGTDRTMSTGTNDRTRTSTTTTNNTTTNTTTTTQPAAPSSGLLNLYADSSAGDSIDGVVQQAKLLGLSADCEDHIVVQVCVFTDENGNQVITKNLRGTDMLSSVTKNF